MLTRTVDHLAATESDISSQLKGEGLIDLQLSGTHLGATVSPVYSN